MERPTTLAVAAVLAVSLLVAPLSAGVPAAVSEPRGTDATAATGASAPADGWSDARSPAVTPPSTSDNTTARLVIPRDRVDRSAFDTVTVGLGTSLQVDAAGARYEHKRTAIRRAFGAADGVAERRNVVDRALIDLSAQANELETAERRALRNYSNGTISTGTMLRRLARIDAEAREIEAALEVVRQLTNRIGTQDFDGRIRDVDSVVTTLRGPVRNRVRGALSGKQTPARVYVVASDRGLVLSMLHEGTYLREATLWSNRNRSGSTQLDFGEVGERFEQLYPWVTNQTGGTSISWQGAGAWKLRAIHSQGVLTASVDASTSQVYREVQRLDVAELPNTMTVVRYGGGVKVSFQRTYSGGPLRLLIEDAATDAVVNARVSVAGHELGRIGADGLVVTLEPRPPYTVNVTTNGTTASFTMERPFNATGG